MRGAERIAWAAVVATLALVALVGRRPGSPSARAASPTRPRAEPGVRLTMDRLHQQGGVPLAWSPTLAPGDARAGRAAFVELGCPACHRVAGEAFAMAADDARGPELSGMGSHHPAAYFAEAVLNPDAVVIEAPGAQWIGDDGRSIMPTYDAMTVGQLTDVVAYLASLTEHAPPSCHGGATPAGTSIDLATLDLRGRPAPAAGTSPVYFAQTYDVRPGKLAAFESWFATDGRSRFLAADGVVSVETYVDAAKPAAALTTLVGFRDEAALRTFMADPATAELWTAFDGFVGAHGHHAADRPLVYRAPSLSIAADGPAPPAER